MFTGKHRTDLDLSGKTVLITGAASPAGIGHSLAIDLLNLPKAPSRLILWDIAKFVDFEDGETRNNTTIITRKVDVTDYEKVNELIKNDGSIHVCVCNAGIGVGLKFKDMPFAKYMKTIDVNFLAKVQMTKTVLEHHFDTIEHFVYVSSMASYIGAGRMSEYCPSKAAIRSFSESLGAELAKSDRPIECTAICPYFAKSNITEEIKDPLAKYTWTTVETISDSILKGLKYPELHTIPVGYCAYVVLGFLNLCGTAFLSRSASSRREFKLKNHKQ